ncbi:TPA: DNA cytosine methyltransferase [Burkholderia vietnamiensis]|nr:DNA cytosine methyltransferase [Burkholderia vietnamiensis]
MSLARWINERAALPRPARRPSRRPAVRAREAPRATDHVRPDGRQAPARTRASCHPAVVVAAAASRDQRAVPAREHRDARHWRAVRRRPHRAARREAGVRAARALEHARHALARERGESVAHVAGYAVRADRPFLTTHRLYLTDTAYRLYGARVSAYYNEIDPHAAQWLRNLIAAGHIAPGDVDERSIEDVQPDDLRGYTQCHWFAGVGVWSYALRRAGWPDDRPVWTGSCPCQPFSAAGKGGGFDDERHLWPHWHWLIAECRPAVVFGEQVASSAVDEWIDLVQTDVEALDYAYGCVPFPSAGVGAPHIRDRTFWLAYAHGRTRGEGSAFLQGWLDRGDAEPRPGSCSSSMPSRLADSHHHRFQRRTGEAVFGARGWQEGYAAGRSGASLVVGMGHADGAGSRRDAGSIHRAQRGTALRESAHGVEPAGAARGLGNPDHLSHGAQRSLCGGENTARTGSAADEPAGPANGFWRAADWLLCRDGKWRPVEPGTFPLVDGAPARVGRLRAYGNAINAEAATAFIKAACDALGDYDLC